MRVLIDTNAYSELARGNTRIRSIIENASEVLVSAVVLGELHTGFALGSKELENNQRLAAFLKLPGIHVIDVNRAIAERYGATIVSLRKLGTPLPTNDIWIAATGLETGSRVLTFDAHFDHIPGVMRVLT